jgi:N-acetylglucosamine kinase-like BadF-type ATPase
VTPEPVNGWLVGVDAGGSSTRTRAVNDDGRRIDQVTASVGAQSGGMNGAVLTALESLTEREPSLLDDGVRAIGIGASGFGTLASGLPQLRARIGELMRTDSVGIAADALTAHLGALGGEPGAMIAVGTGAIALALDDHGGWRRVDGWGHLIGDRGSAAWIGARGLACALEAFDGRDPGGRRLLELATELLGDPWGWPAQVYGRHDSARVMGSFAPLLTAAAEAGDSAASRIAGEAGRSLAITAATACSEAGVPDLVAWTGEVFNSRPVLDAFLSELSARHPSIRTTAALGTPLDGAVVLARRAEAPERMPAVDGLLLW